MRIRSLIVTLYCFSFLSGIATAQVVEEEEKQLVKKTSAIPKAVDFSRLFEQEEMKREDFEALKAQKQRRLEERLAQRDALEGAVDPEMYIVGPGDIFSFNVWGALEMQYPLEVTPGGKLLIPSVGEIAVDGMSVSQVQSAVQDTAAAVYENSRVSLSLEALRYFRVHVVGEVEYPGTYIAQAVDRVSEMIAEAGGCTERAWRRAVEIRHPDGRTTLFDLDSFDHSGDLSQNVFVSGGDVVFVPSIGLGENLVEVEGDLLNSGTYKIHPGETLLEFLKRIRVLKRNTDLSKITVIRTTESEEGMAREKEYLNPFSDKGLVNDGFALRKGDHVVIPTNYVYVKGAVRVPGAYPFVLNLTAKDYAGMAGGDYRSGSIQSVKVFHTRTGKTEKGPNVYVEAGDVVHLNPSWNQRIGNYLQLIPAITALVLTANAAGLFGN